MKNTIVHIVGTGTIGEPLIGLFTDFRDRLEIDEVTFHKRTPLASDRSKINHLLARIGRWHDAELSDPARHISPLRPHDLRHTFAYRLAQVTGADAYELERRLGHRSQRYIQRYTNPPEDVAATYVEEF